MTGYKRKHERCVRAYKRAVTALDEAKKAHDRARRNNATGIEIDVCKRTFDRCLIAVEVAERGMKRAAAKAGIR